LISVSLAPGSYFFWASAGVSRVADISATLAMIMCLFFMVTPLDKNSELNTFKDGV
jgi:hypothetical protein